MVGTVFPPSHQLNKVSDALDIIALIYEIAHSDNVAKNINEASLALSKAKELSLEKQKQLDEAEATIAKADKFVEEFTNRKLESEKEINEHYEIIETQKRQLAAQASDLELLKADHATKAAKAKTDADNTLALAKKAQDDALDWKKKLEAKEADIAAREKTLAENKAALEKAHADKVAKLEADKAAHEASLAKFAKEKEAFDLKKKKLDAAIAE